MKLALAVILAASAPALADKVDPAKTHADSLFEKGQAHYQAGEYQAAIELFKSAYELVHDPVYLFNIAQSYRKIADCAEAYDYYARYLAEANDPANRDKVQSWLRELQPCADKTRAEHEAAVKAAEDERRRQQVAPPPPPVAIDVGRTYRIAGLASAGVGVVGLAVGIGFALHGKSLHDQIDAQCPMGMCAWDSAAPGQQTPAQLDADGHRANTWAALDLIVGGLAVFAGAGLYYYGHTKVETRVMVSTQPGGAVVGARLTF